MHSRKKIVYAYTEDVHRLLERKQFFSLSLLTQEGFIDDSSAVLPPHYGEAGVRSCEVRSSRDTRRWVAAPSQEGAALLLGREAPECNLIQPYSERPARALLNR